jgi:hypothetical protein
MSNVASVMSLAAGATVPVPEFVGSNSNSVTNGESVTVDISAIDVQENDMILVGFFVGEDANQLSTMSMSSTGYTELTSRYASDTYDINMKTFGKIADGTETNVVTNGGIISTASVAVIVSIFRNIEEILPTDLSTGLVVEGGSANTDVIVWPEVTGTQKGELLVYFGATGHVKGNTVLYTNPADLADFTTIAENDSEDLTAGYGYKIIDTESSFTASTWNLSGDGAASAVAYVTFKLSKA